MNAVAPFRNAPLTDFTNAVARENFGKAVISMRDRFPIDVYPKVNGEDIAGSETIARENPSDIEETVASLHCGSEADADRAVAAALAAWPAWRDSPIDQRAATLNRLGDALESHRFELAALEVHEVGKPWREADADIAEAIDFCRFYAHQAPLELGRQTFGEIPGERNVGWHEGRGVAAIIAPWNFPIAILAGMTTAALVSGNTVVIKPAEQSSACAQRFFDLLMESRIPSGVAQFLPGIGEKVGAALVAHPDVSTIAFTGSKAVGLGIIERAGHTLAGQAQVKRVICEMGGKNGIVIDEDADLDDAIAGVVNSAFGYAGQKCSACSRVIVHERVYDAFRTRLIEAIKSLHIARSDDPECQLGPVVDADAHARLMKVLSAPGTGAECLFKGQTLADGHFVPPALFEVKDESHAMLHEEYFGPILAIARCSDFEHGIAIANATDYALTGGVYTRNPNHVRYAERHFRVGNLYFNRHITGAFVSRQPFGGFGMSGAGTKAGGANYLMHFTDARVATENTMRHGFTPETED